jgi:hypothetical protein
MASAARPRVLRGAPAEGAPNTILLQLATNTWHAYNDFGGRNLYTGGHHLLAAAADGARLPAQAGGRRPAGHHHHPPDPDMNTHVGYLRSAQAVAVRRLGRVARLGAAVPAVGRARGLRVDVCTNADLEDHPELLDGTERLLLSVGHDEYWSGPMRDTVRGVHRPRRQRRLLLRQHLVLAGAVGGCRRPGTATPHGRLQGPVQERPGLRHRPHRELTSIWSDHLIGRPENHMTGVSFSRGGYHRIGKRVTNGAGGYTIHRRRPLAVRRHRHRLRRRARARSHHRRLRVRRLRLHLPRRPALPDRRRRHARRLHHPGHRTGRALHPHHRARARRKPHEPAEDEFIAGRLFGTRDAAAVERVAHGHAVLGTYTSAGRRHRRHLRQHRLGPRPRRPRPAGGAHHRQRARPAVSSVHTRCGLPSRPPSNMVTVQFNRRSNDSGLPAVFLRCTVT